VNQMGKEAAPADGISPEPVSVAGVPPYFRLVGDHHYSGILLCCDVEECDWQETLGWDEMLTEIAARAQNHRRVVHSE